MVIRNGISEENDMWPGSELDFFPCVPCVSYFIMFIFCFEYLHCHTYTEKKFFVFNPTLLIPSKYLLLTIISIIKNFFLS